MTAANLRRVIGVWGGTALIVGITIGSGIFRKPPTIAELAPNPLVIIALWTAFGVISTCGALTVAELSSLLPRPGGLYVFLREAYGDAAAFVFGWLYVLVTTPAVIAALAVVFAEFLLNVLGVIAEPFTTQAIAIAAIITLTLVNFFGAQVGAAVGSVCTAVKVAALVAIIAGSFLLGHGSVSNLTGSGAVRGGGLARAVASVIFTYDGWIAVSMIAGEVIAPERLMKRIIIAGMLIIVVLYIGANLAYFYMMPIDVMARQKEAIARTVVSSFAGPTGGTVILLAIMTSVFGALDGNFLARPRVAYAMARDGLIFPFLGKVHPRWATPWAALLVQSAAAIMMVLALRDFDTLTTYFVVVEWAALIAAVASVFVLRRKMPHAPRPYRTPAYPWVPLCFMIGTAVGLTAIVWGEIAVGNYSPVYGLGIAAAGFPVHHLWKRLTNRVPLVLFSLLFVSSIVSAQTFDHIAHPKAGEWPTYNGQLSGNRHSSLSEIDVGNVANLVRKWTFPIGGPRSLQVTPVVVNGVMYVTAVNEAQALDARTGQQIWKFSRPQTPGLVPTGDPASGINRGVAVLGGRVFLQTDHAHLLALDGSTGRLLWDVEMADYHQHYGATGAPLAVNDLVIAGISAGDEGVRGFLDAYKASTGERVWRFWTVPARGEPGSETWIGKALEHGCATTWLTGTYDPEAKLLYWPTGNPCPDYNGDERKGDNLYSSSVVALDPRNGKLRWHFQFTPHDLHDWDGNQPPLLLDSTFHGRRRKLLAVGSRNGFFYVLDRLTGEFLMAQPFVKNLTWASGIGPDGRPVLLPGYENAVDGTRTCPSQTGAANWPSTAFNPATGLFYLMAGEACAIYTRNSDWFELGKSFYGGTTRPAPVDGGGKFLRALDLQTGKLVWEVPNVGGSVSGGGLMSTAGGLVFYGDNTGGAFVAVDATNGKRLWHFDTGQIWKASPMTYAIDGRQYIAVVAGSTVMVFGLP